MSTTRKTRAAKKSAKPKKTTTKKAATDDHDDIRKAKTGDAKAKRLSALDAAATVLRKSATPMRATELITAMAEQGLWSSPKGKTPHATLYAAMCREINAKGSDARFTKVDRGQFAFNMVTKQ